MNRKWIKIIPVILALTLAVSVSGCFLVTSNENEYRAMQNEEGREVESELVTETAPETETADVETETVSGPNNYMREVEQLSRCRQTEEKPLVTKDFSLLAARTADRILADFTWTTSANTLTLNVIKVYTSCYVRFHFTYKK